MSGRAPSPREDPTVRAKYQCPVSRCYVRRSARPDLVSFRAALVRWHDWLFDDEHAIWPQISQMMWNDTVFRTINESRRLAEQRGARSAALNGMVGNFIDQGYATGQLLAIRRLTDRSPQGDVISLPRLIDDMKANARLFTRELWVCRDGVPYSLQRTQMRRLAKLTSQAGSQGTSFQSPSSGSDAYSAALRMHQQFDRLARISAGQRSRDDRVDEAVFDNLKSKLGGADKYNRYASKFLAHAANKAARGKLEEGERQITLKNLQTCHQMSCRVAEYISGPLLYFGSHGVVPIPQFNQFKHLEQPWVHPDDVDSLCRFWGRREDCAKNWCVGAASKLNLPG